MKTIRNLLSRTAMALTACALALAASTVVARQAIAEEPSYSVIMTISDDYVLGTEYKAGDVISADQIEEGILESNNSMMFDPSGKALPLSVVWLKSVEAIEGASAQTNGADFVVASEGLSTMKLTYGATWDKVRGVVGPIICDPDNRPCTANCHVSVLANNCHITFDANGGAGAMDAQPFHARTPFTLHASTFTRAGYSFEGWNTAANGSGIAVPDEKNVSAGCDLTLYAQWKKVPQPADAKSAPAKTATK